MGALFSVSRRPLPRTPASSSAWAGSVPSSPSSPTSALGPYEALGGRLPPPLALLLGGMKAGLPDECWRAATSRCVSPITGTAIAEPAWPRACLLYQALNQIGRKAGQGPCRPVNVAVTSPVPQRS